MQRYQEGLEESMKGIEFIFDIVDVLYYNLNKISLNLGGTYIDSPKWLKNKKATINPGNNDDKCLQYAFTTALNHEQIKSHPEKISNIKSFIDQYDWKGISFPSHKKDWEKFELNNKSIALNLSYKSKNNLNRENEVILLMITDSKRCGIILLQRNCLQYLGK